MNISTFSGYYDKENGWWLPSSEINGLFFFSNDGKSRYIGQFDNERMNPIITKTIMYENKIYFFSRHGYEFWVIDRYESKIDYKKILDYKGKIITNVEIVDGEIWFFPDSFENSIVKYSLESTKYEVINWNCSFYLGKNSITRTIIKGKDIYFASRLKKEILLFSLNTKTSILTNRRFEMADFINCLTIDDDAMWMLYIRDGITYIGNDAETDRKEYNVSNVIKLDDSPQMLYFKMISFGEIILLFSSLSNQIVVFEKKKGLCKKIELYQGEKNVSGYSAQNDIQIIDEEVIIYSPGNYCINAINMNTLNQRMIDVEIEEQQIIESLKMISLRNNIHMESKIDKLHRFIMSIS